ncbi:MAG: VanZ family protein [Clostridia bacterium]|nr:VanZ family protein [Clostridia bacterium]
MNKKILRIVFIILLISIYALIFYFSSQNGEDSSNLSGGLVRKILYALGIVSNMKTESIFEVIIRKLAHFSLYFLCGLLLYLTFITTKLEGKFKVILSILINVLYAVFDEIHQCFIVGRSGKMADVFVDLTGIICGVVVIIAIMKLYKGLSKNKEENVKE